MSLHGKNIYYILTGARKSAEAKYNIATLRELGANVYVIMTESAKLIADMEELEEISGNFVRDSFVKRHPDHSLPLEDLVIVAPATYNTINKIANGIADTLATSLVATSIGRKVPVYVAPAMHYELWTNPILQENVEKLRRYGVKIIHPAVENGKATMAERLKVLDTVIHDFVRIRYSSEKMDNLEYVDRLNAYRRQYYLLFQQIGRQLEELQLNGASSGCLSVKVEDGFLVTASGSCLGQLEPEDLSLVIDCDAQKNLVYWCGQKMPSSETPLHYVIYRRRREVGAVLHSHCPAITYGPAYKKYRTLQYYSYGTFEFGENIVREMSGEKKNFIIAKDHGQVVVGQTLEQAFKRLVDLYSFHKGEKYEKTSSF